MDLSQLTLPVLLALVIGRVLKWKLSDQRLRDLIPVWNFAIQLLGQLALEAAPAQAGILGSLANVAKGPLLDMAMQSLLVTALASGAQSSAKNVGKALGMNTLALARQRLILMLGGKVE